MIFNHLYSITEIVEHLNSFTGDVKTSRYETEPPAVSFLTATRPLDAIRGSPSHPLVDRQQLNPSLALRNLSQAKPLRPRCTMDAPCWFALIGRSEDSLRIARCPWRHRHLGILGGPFDTAGWRELYVAFNRSAIHAMRVVACWSTWGQASEARGVNLNMAATCG